MNKSTLVPREEMSDLDWLARNVHKWPAGDHQPWCYVYMSYGGVMKAAGNFLDAVVNPTMITIEQWLARRAELQNKPSWEDFRESAKFMAQDSDGTWRAFEIEPTAQSHIWNAKRGWRGYAYEETADNRGEVLGDWRDTLEKRPEQKEFEAFISIEDNQVQVLTQQQDNGWFERGELPPVGCECEILGAFGHYQEWFPCKIIAEHSGSVFAANERSWMNVRKGERQFRPLRTERDVLIEIIKKTDDTDDKIADAILAAGFKRGAA